MKRLVVWAALAVSLTACGETEESDTAVIDTPVAPYQVMLEKDYVALTGCDFSPHLYEAALDYLVFDEGEDKESFAYVQRETIFLFNELRKEGGSIDRADAACLPQSLRRIGEELGLLVSINNTEFDNSGADGYGPGANPMRFDPDAENFPVEEGLTYSIQSRSEYMISTECLVSPSSYEKFRDAFDAFFFRNGEAELAPIHMAAFLSDVRDSRPMPDDSLNPQCLTPGILKLGKEMGVLSENGKLINQDN